MSVPRPQPQKQVGQTEAEKVRAAWNAAHPQSAAEQAKTGERIAAATQGSGGWIPGPIGTATKAFLGAPGDLINHVGTATGDAAQGKWGDAANAVVNGVRDAANLTTGGTASFVIGSSDNPNGGLIKTPGDGLSPVTGLVKTVANGIGALGGNSGGPPTQAQSDVASDVANSRNTRDRLLDAYNTATPRAAPVAAAPDAAPVTQVGPTTVGPAAQAAPVTVGPAAQAAPAPTVEAAPIAHTSIGPAATYGAATIAGTPDATAGQASAATVDSSQQAQFRADQKGLVDQLKGAAAGTAPSAAEAMLQRANDAAIKQQMSLTAGASGTSRLAQRLSGAENIADLEQKNALDTAQVRAQEQATARQQLGTALEGARGQDIGLATTGAQLSTDVSKTNAGLTTNVAISNADRMAAKNMKQADLEQAASAGNAAAKNEIAERQATLNSTENVATASNALDASKTNAGNTVAINTANAAAQNQLTALQAQITAQGGVANAQQENDMRKLQATITAGANTADAAAANVAATQQKQSELQTNLANQDAALKARGLDDAQRQALLQAYAQQQAQALGWDTSQADLALQKYKSQLILAGAVAGGASGLLSTLATGGAKTGG